MVLLLVGAPVINVAAEPSEFMSQVYAVAPCMTVMRPLQSTLKMEVMMDWPLTVFAVVPVDAVVKIMAPVDVLAMY